MEKSGKRRITRHRVPPGRNSMRYCWQLVHPLRVVFNFLIIVLCRYLPWMDLKNILYRSCLGMKVGCRVSVGLMAMMDIFFPQLISIGDNSVIGYNTTILCHEFLVDEYRIGPVVIGANVMVGANTTILPGVVIGDGAIIGAGSLVNRDIPPGVLAAGVPARVVKVLGEEDA